MLVYLLANGDTVSGYAAASAELDPQGRFTTSFIVPADPRWQTEEGITVVARVVDSDTTVRAVFDLIQTPLSDSPPSVLPTPTSTQSSPSPTAALTLVPSPTVPLISANTDLNIRSGPGMEYPILGLLPAEQVAEATGRSADGTWYQIMFAGVANGRGWLSARYVTAQNVDNLPVVQAPPLPPTPTSVPTAPRWW